MKEGRVAQVARLRTNCQTCHDIAHTCHDSDVFSAFLCVSNDDVEYRFLLKDTKANCWVDVGFEYAKEKVSHALRSRPTEDRRKRVKPKKKEMRKPSFSPELEDLVQGMITDQQTLLQSLIDREVVSSPPKAQVSS